MTSKTAAPDVDRQTYGQVLKATALIGGSSVVTIAFGIVRNKALALMLGPGGVGLMGLYTSIAELWQSVASMGVQSSGVRQIAAAVGSGDYGQISITATVLRRVSFWLGAVGALLLAAVAAPASVLTFGSHQHASAIALLSLAVLCRVTAAGQSALIQGMRRLSDLASLSVLGALLGTIVSIVAIYVWRERGIVPSLIGTAAATVVTSWWYSRRISVDRRPIAPGKLVAEASRLLRLGVAFMASGLLTMGAAYMIRLIILRMEGVEAAGLYQAAWALGGLYVGFILQAMGTDFYPRLTAVATNNRECNRLVNEQALISLLLAGPGVIATLTWAPLVVGTFYSSEFGAAVGLLRWICLGMILRIVAWPMGFIVLAKGAQNTFIWTEIAATCVHVLLAWGLVARFGVSGAGAAFFGLYVWHGFLIYAVVQRMSGFRWSEANRRIGCTLLLSCAGVFCSFYVLPSAVAFALGTGAVCLTAAYSIRQLTKLLPPDSLPGSLRAWLPRSMFATDVARGNASAT